MKKIKGFEISEHEKSKRIINLKIEDEILDKLIFPFNKFNITALEYKPFTRFTIAKSLDDLTSNELGKLLNSIVPVVLCVSSSKLIFSLFVMDVWSLFL